MSTRRNYPSIYGSHGNGTANRSSRYGVTTETGAGTTRSATTDRQSGLYSRAAVTSAHANPVISRSASHKISPTSSAGLRRYLAARSLPATCQSHATKHGSATSNGRSHGNESWAANRHHRLSLSRPTMDVRAADLAVNGLSMRSVKPLRWSEQAADVVESRGSATLTRRRTTPTSRCRHSTPLDGSTVDTHSSRRIEVFTASAGDCSQQRAVRDPVTACDIGYRSPSTRWAPSGGRTCSDMKPASNSCQRRAVETVSVRGCGGGEQALCAVPTLSTATTTTGAICPRPHAQAVPSDADTTTGHHGSQRTIELEELATRRQLLADDGPVVGTPAVCVNLPESCQRQISPPPLPPVAAVVSRQRALVSSPEQHQRTDCTEIRPRPTLRSVDRQPALVTTAALHPPSLSTPEQEVCRSLGALRVTADSGRTECATTPAVTRDQSPTTRNEQHLRTSRIAPNALSTVGRDGRVSLKAADISSDDDKTGTLSGAAPRLLDDTSSSTFFFSRNSGLCGLRNIGNTCFMNAVLQCLSCTQQLHSFILHEPHRSRINRSKSKMNGHLLGAFSGLLTEMWTQSSQHCTALSTAPFKQQIQRYAPRFMGYQQQDAQEFLRYLLEGLHEEVNEGETPATLNSDNAARSESQSAEDCWQRFLSRENSLFVHLFVGQLRSTLTCTSCGHMSTTFDPFWDLSVPIPANQLRSVPLECCLDLFTSEECLDGSEMPICDSCKCRRKCTKSLTIERCPRVLVIHLKRFSPAAGSQQYRGKLGCRVHVPLDGMELSRYCSQPLTCGTAAATSVYRYSLYAVANHSGTLYTGHYTAHCLHPYLRQWHEFDDSRVTKLPTSGVVTSEAYLLFFQPTTQVTQATPTQSSYI